MSKHLEVLVIGAGAVGLAAARSIALAGYETIVVDRHMMQGMETSSRNSEVIHAGLYYAPGSLKARLCVAGREMMYRYARERNIPHRQCGKLIVAGGEVGALGLARIEQCAAAAGAGPLKRIDKAELLELEPEVAGDCGLLSPRTGLIDSHALMVSYLADLENAGGSFARQTSVARVDHRNDHYLVTLEDGAEVTARHVVNSAGLRSGDIAATIDALDAAFKPVIRYARGVYFKATNAPKFRHLVYPLPTNASLGVHATVDLQGQVRFGPDVEWISDRDDYTVDPARASQFAEGIRAYWPQIDPNRLIPDYAGIRPKLVGPGEPPADFRIDGPADHGLPGLICLHGIESPGLTSSLALGDYVARRLLEQPLAR